MRSWNPAANSPHRGRFPSTRWSLVLSSGDSDSETSRAALEALCNQYWSPLYAFARQEGKCHEDAADLVQGFFESVLNGKGLHRADERIAQFRTYLLRAFRNYCVSEWRRASALKRGGATKAVAIDWDLVAGQYVCNPALSPEQLFHRQWVADLLKCALDRVRCEYAQRDSTALFDAFKHVLTGLPEPNTYMEIGAAFGLSEGGAKSTAHRLTKRFREVFREVVVETLDDERGAEDEVAYLLTTLG